MKTTDTKKFEIDEEDAVVSITFTPADVEVLETILEKYGRNLDQTGIIAHILNEISLKKEIGEHIK